MIARLIVMFVLLLGLAGITAADDVEATCSLDGEDTSLPACFTPEDNACYAGGAMEGKCDTEWEWLGGWHLARLGSLYTRDNFPADFVTLLPGEAEAAAPAPAAPKAMCFSNGGEDILYSGVPNKLGNIVRAESDDGSCTDLESAPEDYRFIIVGSEEFAEDLCRDTFPDGDLDPMTYEGFDAPANYWLCEYD